MSTEEKKSHKKGKDHSDKEKKGHQPNKKNHKAFNVANVVSTKRNMQRNLDKAQQKEVVPLRSAVDGTTLSAPDLIVVMGPKGVGKSTLIRSLVKLYTEQNLVDILGPVTVVAGDRKRLTFFECPMDLYSMTDLAKVADLVIIMIDASYGFEMETFEFFNLLQLHGMPKVVGVLSHLDSFRNIKSLQKAKKAIKHRFWTEIFKGAKLYEMMGTINRKYRKHEVKRLALAISRIKYRPLVWRNNHPYVLVDRVEEAHTSPETAAEGLKDLILYGFVRGSHLKATQKIHLIGAGDFDISELSNLPDPCPCGKGNEGLVKKRKDSLLYAPMANVGRVVLDGDNLYIDLKRVNYSTKDSLYLPDQQSAVASTLETGPMSLLRGLQEIKTGMDTQLADRAQQSMQLFANEDFLGADYKQKKSSKVEDLDGDEEADEDDAEDDQMNESMQEGDEDEDEYDREDGDEEEDDEEESEDEDDEDDEDDEEEDENDDTHLPALEGEDDSEEDEDDRDATTQEDADARRGSRLQSVIESNLGAFQQRKDIMQDIYGLSWAQKQDQQKRENKVNSKKSKKSQDRKAQHKCSLLDSDDEDEEDDDEDEEGDDAFFTIKRSGANQRGRLDALDSSRSAKVSSHIPMKEMTAGVAAQGRGDRHYFLFKTRFAAGNPLLKNAKKSDLDDLLDLEDGDDEENEGEDEENSEDEEDKNDAIDEQLRSLHQKKKAQFSKSMEGEMEHQKKQQMEKKMGVVDAEDADERNLIEEAQQRFLKQSERNALEFGKEGETLRVSYEGFRQGLYVRMLIRRVPQEFLEHFRAQSPVIAGGLLANETAMGFITARVKKHRWHKRILKSQDPLIFSIGWRRYQSLPVFTTTDANDRERHLKYTPQHMHCTATFYGPLVAPNTGILAYQSAANDTAGFRIAMTGTALEQRATPQVKKKLKLVGTPLKVYKNTAFISGMFSSALEAAKFEHAKIKTVSGIRGSIKKAVLDHSRAKEANAGSKKAVHLPPGTFRASFEDKILASDLVVCRLWVPVEVKRFYNPVLSLLSSGAAPKKKEKRLSITEDGEEEDEEEPEEEEEEKATGLLMRNTAQLRRDLKVPQQVQKDSVYKPVVRQQREFSKLKIPSKLQEALPYKSRVKHEAQKNRKSYEARRAVVLEPEERRSRALMAAVHTIAKDKEGKRRIADQQRSEQRKARQERESARFADVKKDEKRKRYRDQGLTAQRQEREAAGRASKRQKKHGRDMDD